MIVLHHNTVGALRHGLDVSRRRCDDGAWVLVSGVPAWVPAALIYARAADLGPEAERLYYEHWLSDCALCAACDAALDRMLARVA